MFGIGSSELIIVFLIALLVLGPEELPKVARSVGRAVRKIQHATDDIKHTITAEIEEEERAITDSSAEAPAPEAERREKGAMPD